MQSEEGPTRSGVTTRVEFRVLQAFKGSQRDRVALALQPSSEEFPYVKGQRVLVYANRAGRTWSTACARTRLVSDAGSELVVLAALRKKL